MNQLNEDWYCEVCFTFTGKSATNRLPCKCPDGKDFCKREVITAQEVIDKQREINNKERKEFVNELHEWSERAYVTHVKKWEAFDKILVRLGEPK